VKYIEKNVDKTLKYTAENVAKYMAFTDVILGFKTGVLRLLTEEENNFYNEAFGAVTKFYISGRSWGQMF
jgi:hypothetical protein